MSRRTLLRVVIVVAIGIPVVLEGLTFIGLVSNQLGGDAGGPGAGPPIDSARGVAVGDDLLRGTDQREILDAAVVSTNQGWRFSLVVNVTNTGRDGYRLALDSVTTKGGETVAGGGSTASLASETGTRLTATWDLPDGQVPETVTVRATVPTGNRTRTVTETVHLETVSIQG